MDFSHRTEVPRVPNIYRAVIIRGDWKTAVHRVGEASAKTSCWLRHKREEEAWSSWAVIWSLPANWRVLRLRLEPPSKGWASSDDISSSLKTLLIN